MNAIDCIFFRSVWGRFGGILLLCLSSTLAAVAKSPEFEDRLLRFHSDEQWRPVRPPGAAQVPFVFRYVEPGYLLRAEPSAEPFRIDLRSEVVSNRSRHQLENPRSVRFSLREAQGDGLEISPVFVDEEGESHRVKPLEVSRGDSELNWSFPEDVVSSTGGDGNRRIDGDLRLEAIHVRREGGKREAASVRLLRVDYVGRPDPVRFRFEPSDPVNHVRPGRESEARLVFESDLTEPVEVEIDAELHGYDGSRQEHNEVLRLEPGGPHDWPLPFVLGDTGLKRLRVEARYAGRTEHAELRFAYIEPAGVTPRELRGFRFGTNANRTANAEAQAREFRAMGFIGIDIARCGYDWWQIEKTQGDWDWSPVDRIYRNAELNDVDIQTALLYSVPWATRPEFVEANRGQTLRRKDYWTAAPREDLWRDYVRRHVERYRGRILMYEIWNEPDLRGFYRGNTDQFLGLLKAAYEEIKAVNPEQVVMSPGMAHAGYYHGHYLNPDMYERVMGEGQGYFEIHAAHEHGTFETFQRVVDGPLAEMRGLLRSHKPLLFNETALSSYPHGQRVQAETLVKKLAFAWGRGAVGYFWFNHRERAGETPSERGFGSITPDFQPKAVYCAYNELIKLLRGKRFVGELDLGSEQWGFIFGDGRERVLVYWASDLPGQSPRPYALHLPRNTVVHRVDIMGNREDVGRLDGYLLLRPGVTPRYLVFSSALEPLSAPVALVTRPEDGLALLTPGVSGELVMELSNPLRREAEYELRWLLPDGVVTPSDPAQSLKLAPEGRAQTRLPITVPRATAQDAGRRAAVELSYRLVDTDWRGRVVVPVAIPMIFSGERSSSRAPDVILDQYAQVKNFAENDPSSEHLTWQGVDDLSARAWISLDAEAFHLRVDVRDDRHVQPKRRRSIWQGDSVQLGLTLPGKPGHWEIGIARTTEGDSVYHVWNLPAGTDSPDVRFAVETALIPGGMRYIATLPLDVLGWEPGTRTAGFGFNLLVNDNDAGIREGVIRFAEGIGPDADPGRYPVVVFP